jgi:general L-amino acid transport system permease protein
METSIDPKSRILPPPDPPGPSRWIRENLFGSLLNTILTIISLTVVLYALGAVINWVFITADWRPVTEGPTLYAIGQYPRDQMWRIGLALGLVSLMTGLSWGRWNGFIRGIAIGLAALFALFALLPVQHNQLSLGVRLGLGANTIAVLAGWLIGKQEKVKTALIITGWAITPVLVIILFAGFEGSSFLQHVNTTSWGGLMVTFLLAVGGILLSFPLGVIMALGRRSKLPVVSIFSTIYIETIRGVPLITILFMFSIILALFLPQETRLDRLLRALLAVIVFSSAYTAENVRGGLPAVPPGQIEAAKALGMNNFKVMLFIVLPQAIRAVIPAIVGQFIALFKDTTLVIIIGINDLLGIGKSIINSKPEFVQLQTEVYIFIAAIYWIFSYLMSMASRRVEESLGVGDR